MSPDPERMPKDPSSARLRLVLTLIVVLLAALTVQTFFLLAVFTTIAISRERGSGLLTHDPIARVTATNDSTTYPPPIPVITRPQKSTAPPVSAPGSTNQGTLSGTPIDPLADQGLQNFI